MLPASAAKAPQSCGEPSEMELLKVKWPVAAVAGTDHSSSSPLVGRGSCPEKALGFCCGTKGSKHRPTCTRTATSH